MMARESSLGVPFLTSYLGVQRPINLTHQDLFDPLPSMVASKVSYIVTSGLTCTM